MLRVLTSADVACGLVKALTSSNNLDRKRILMSGEWFSWKNAVEYIASERPELKGRLSGAAKEYAPAPTTPIDNTRAKEVLGLEMTPRKVTVLDAVNSLVKLENKWKSKGLTPRDRLWYNGMATFQAKTRVF
ncbi:hypothetical protein AcW1_008856 [Taiwanofungus camphoratus]|nr:hypothetical protein AcV7_007140 [Antrodia cinnamomea]KAI0930090.1 hypothetical protein AcV5_006887 [Antrodia cinnamomea]KAI0949165.1 hypothetical protein AcW1_008856 [Antrodia cinnamomea]